MNGTPIGVLARARLIVFILLAGQVIFGGVVAFLFDRGTVALRGGPMEVYGPLAWAVLVLSLVTVVALRARASRIRLGGRTLPPEEWLRGKILAAALMEAPVLLALTLLLVTGEVQPFAVVAGIGFLMSLATFPLSGPTE